MANANLRPNVIDVFAFVPPTGVGNEYAWAGRIHRTIEYTLLDTARVPMYSGGELYFSHEDLDEVAKNLASMIKTHPSLAHNLERVPAYQLNYTSVGSLGKKISKGRDRVLTPEEEMSFDESFKRFVLWGI